MVRAVRSAGALKLCLGLAAVATIAIIFYQGTKSGVRIDVFALPKLYEDYGYTGSVVGERIVQTLSDMRLALNSEGATRQLDVNQFALPIDQTSLPDFTVPSTGISIRSVVNFLQSITGAEPSVARIEVTLIWPAPKEVPEQSRPDAADIIIRFGNGSRFHGERTLHQANPAPDSVVQAVSEEILHHFSPYNYGVYMRRTKRFNNAIAAAKEIVGGSKDTQSQSIGYYLWGSCLLELKKPDLWGAVDKYQRAIKLDPNLAVALNGLGDAYFSLQRLGEAERSYRLFLAKEPRSLTAHYNLAALLLAENKVAEASSLATAATKLPEDSANTAVAYTVLGNCLRAAGKPDEAIAQYKVALEKWDHLSVAHAGWANALVQKHDLSGAIEEYQKASCLGYASSGDAQMDLTYENWERTLRNLGRVSEANALRHGSPDLTACSPG